MRNNPLRREALIKRFLYCAGITLLFFVSNMIASHFGFPIAFSRLAYLWSLYIFVIAYTLCAMLIPAEASGKTDAAILRQKFNMHSTDSAIGFLMLLFLFVFATFPFALDTAELIFDGEIKSKQAVVATQVGVLPGFLTVVDVNDESDEYALYFPLSEPNRVNRRVKMYYLQNSRIILELKDVNW